MGLSRRQFTREFKLAAIERLERGASIAEVARAFEVNPNTLHRWRRDFRQGPGSALPAPGRRGWAGHRQRVYGLVRGENLLWLRRRKFVLTTASDHGVPV